MSKMFANLILGGRKTIDDVPAELLDEVKELLGIVETETVEETGNAE